MTGLTKFTGKASKILKVVEPVATIFGFVADILGLAEPDPLDEIKEGQKKVSQHCTVQ